MQDMVYQGTVLGPILWNLFFGDALHAIRMLKFMESVFADDLHACRSYDVKIPNRSLLDSTKRCQARLHEWGRANQVEFEPTKESITILSRATFFDPGLYMEDAVGVICDSAMWKLRTLQRTTRFFGREEMVHLYKSKVLSYVESKTVAIYHASLTVLQRIDRIQDYFLRGAGITDVEVLCDHRLAPFNCRRDMAMMAVINRTVLGLGPIQFKTYFRVDTEN